MNAREMRRGAVAIAPLLVGALPFAGIYGVTARTAGLDAFETIMMSVIVFAGAAQLAALALLADGAPYLAIIVSVMIVNLRFLLYSASIGPVLRKAPLGWRVFDTYILSDHAYAVTVLEMRGRPASERAVDLPAFFTGAALALMVTWHAGTIAGAVLGTAVPAAWRLDFAVPLSLLAILVSSVRDRPALGAAAVGGAVAVATVALPFKLNLFLGAAAGILAGAIAQRAREGAR